jgi:hypothetical protein
MNTLSKALGTEDFIIDLSDIHCSKNDPEINRVEALQRNSEFIKCPKCGVTGNRPNMMRWHFDKCKTVLKNCKQCGKIIPRQNVKDYLYKQKQYCDRKCYMESKKGKAPINMTPEVCKKVSEARKKYYARLYITQVK